jgi:circadian clock protein KaiC
MVCSTRAMSSTRRTRSCSHLSDNVILLQFLRGESQVKRALTVLKTRASSHDPRILEFEITSNGIELGEQFAEDQSLE